QFCPLRERKVETVATAARTRCRSREIRTNRLSVSSVEVMAIDDMSLRLWPLAQRLRHHTDVLDAGLAQRVHHRGPAPKRHRFVAADVHRLRLRVTGLRNDLLAQVVN